MERRLQLLLDQTRYQRVADEAARSGRSVAAVIREAIDMRFPSGDGERRQRLAELLDSSEAPVAPGESWETIKAEMHHHLDEQLSR